VPGVAGQCTDQARWLNEEGLKAVEAGDLPKAETKFREAIERDLYYAPAHNNLGLALPHAKRYYEAAWEFEYAAKLTPRSVEPRANLGLVYEGVGQLDRAVTEYEKAAQIDAHDAAVMRHLARAYVKADRRDEGLKKLLDRLVLTPGNEQWDQWVRGQLIRVGRHEPDDVDPSQPAQPVSLP
jgi:Flp pilus assembly protein TadD